jgi:hypothetical protein
MGIGLFWIICIIVATIIGSRKGVPWSSFFLGLFFGPLGIILVLVLKGDHQCPFCKKDIDKEALKCPHCQADLTLTSGPAFIDGELSVDNETKKCPSCAEFIKLEAVKCRFCGHDFDPAVVVTEVELRRNALKEEMFGGVSQEGIPGEAFCMGCRMTDPRSQMIYFEDSGTFYHRNCLSKRKAIG